jgi:polygalacturonase
MIKYFVIDKTAVLWWDKKTEYSGSYRVFIDGEKRSKTSKTHARVLLAEYGRGYVAEIRSEDNETYERIELISDVPRKLVDVTKPPYCAVGDGKTLNTDVLQRALAELDSGKILYFPKGMYLTGALDVPSKARIFLDEGATLLGSEDPKEYLPKIKSRYEGIERMCYRSLLNIGRLDRNVSNSVEDVIVYGKGTVCGGGKELAENVIRLERESDRALTERLEREEPQMLRTVFGRARGRLINVSSANNVVLDGLTLKNGPAWNVHMIYSENVVTSDCQFLSEGVWNGDGWDPDSSENCTIFGCTFETGDDCVAIKSGKNPEGNKIAKPCRKIDIFDCRCLYGHGLAIGSEMSGGVEDVRMWDNDFVSSGDGLIIKTQRKRGGYVRNVRVENCAFSRILITSDVGYNADGEAAPTLAEFENFEFIDVTLTGKCFSMTRDVYPVPAISITGYAENGRKFRNMRFKNVEIPKYSDEQKQRIEIQDVENVTFENVTSK